MYTLTSLGFQAIPQWTHVVELWALSRRHAGQQTVPTNRTRGITNSSSKIPMINAATFAMNSTGNEPILLPRS